jgi:hypothetical protein
MKSKYFDFSVLKSTRFKMSREGSADIVMAWTTRVRFPAVNDFTLLHGVQTSFGAHPAFYPMGTRGSFPGGKAAGTQIYTSTPPYVFMA